MINICLLPPVAQPLTLVAAKAAIRTDDDSSDHDDLIARLIDAARQRIEQDTRRRLMAQTWLYGCGYWPREPYIILPQGPVLSVSSIEYSIEHAPTPLDADVDEDNPAETGYVPLAFDVANYTLDEHDNTYQAIRLASGGSWPTDALKWPGLRIVYVCGYLTPPAPLVEAVVSLITYWYDNPEAAIASTVYKAEVGVLPLRYQTLIAPYTLWRR